MKVETAREAAYLAVVEYLTNGTYLDRVLAQLEVEEVSLTRQIAYGTIQRLLSLDYLARKLTTGGALKLKPREKALLFTALYQAHFMDRIPIYAVVNEAVELAKKHFHPRKIPFLNAVLRAYERKAPDLPQGTDATSLSISYSYPEWFVNQTIADYGLSEALKILDFGNRPAPTMARLRGSLTVEESALVLRSPFPVLKVADPKALADSPDYYLQNVTSVHLLGQLAKVTNRPGRILDLCAAPGGKTLLAHDLFPSAHLHANDSSERRLTILRKNFTKYGLVADTSCQAGTEFKSDRSYDLIILDVPCTNSGVLGKRPEARWRLEESAAEDLKTTQLNLIRHAANLLSTNGTIWYVTCSILKGENEQLIARACEAFSLTAFNAQTILPNAEGWDGGFASILKNK